MAGRPDEKMGRFDHLWKKTGGDAAQANDGEADDTPPEIDLGPCAAVPRGKWVTALEVRHRGDKPWEAYQYRDIGYRSTFTPTRFEVWFEGRDERCKLVVKGRNLQGIYALVIQHRLEWIEPAVRDAAEDGQPIITAVEVVIEKVKQ